MDVRDYKVRFQTTGGEIVEGDVRGVPGPGAALREFLLARSIDSGAGRMISCEPTSEPTPGGGYPADHRQASHRRPSEHPAEIPTPDPSEHPAAKPASGRGRKAKPESGETPETKPEEAGPTETLTDGGN